MGACGGVLQCPPPYSPPDVCDPPLSPPPLDQLEQRGLAQQLKWNFSDYDRDHLMRVGARVPGGSSRRRLDYGHINTSSKSDFREAQG